MGEDSLLNPFDDDGRGHAAAGAHGREPAFQIAAFEFIQQRADQDGAGRADRMAEGNRAAIHIYLVAIELQVANEFFSDHRKSFVDFPQIDIRDG